MATFFTRAFRSVERVGPSKTVAASRPNIDMLIVRENTEGLYVGIEHDIVPDEIVEAIRIITRKGSERVARYAFELARREGRRKVTLVHKANILKTVSIEISGIVRSCLYIVSFWGRPLIPFRDFIQTPWMHRVHVIHRP